MDIVQTLGITADALRMSAPNMIVVDRSRFPDRISLKGLTARRASVVEKIQVLIFR
jgi:hypothetical protein